MSEESKQLLADSSILLHEGPVFGFGKRVPILLEPPVEVRRGIYVIDRIGAFSYLGGRETFMRHVASIGRFCSIASNIVCGQVEHPPNFLSAHPVFQGASLWKQLGDFNRDNAAMIEKSRAMMTDLSNNRFGKIVIGNDVWIGEGTFIRRGVTIGDGAVIGARSVVNQDIPPYAIAAGMPAKVIRYRFEPEVIADLKRLRWWDYGTSALRGADFTDVPAAIKQIEQNIAEGVAQLYKPNLIRIDERSVATVV